MNQHFFCHPAFLAVTIATTLLAGCASRSEGNPSDVPVAATKTSGEQAVVAEITPEPKDVAAVADKMARSILGIPEIVRAKNAPRIVLEPVVNETPLLIKREIFVTRMRAELNSKAAGRVRFLARGDMRALEREQQLKHDGIVPVSQDPEAVEFRGTSYFLTGKFQSMPARSGEAWSDSVLYSFQLIDAATSEIVWEDSAEIAREGLGDET
jgi:PBP1b-binding outer membrane lipoprotein LpoB